LRFIQLLHLAKNIAAIRILGQIIKVAHIFGSKHYDVTNNTALIDEYFGSVRAVSQFEISCILLKE
jgi:hypothetical protein